MGIKFVVYTACTFVLWTIALRMIIKKTRVLINGDIGLIIVGAVVAFFTISSVATYYASFYLQDTPISITPIITQDEVILRIDTHFNCYLDNTKTYIENGLVQEGNLIYSEDDFDVFDITDVRLSCGLRYISRDVTFNIAELDGGWIDLMLRSISMQICIFVVSAIVPVMLLPPITNLISSISGNQKNSLPIIDVPVF